jgi:hypothetical protein
MLATPKNLLEQIIKTGPLLVVPLDPTPYNVVTQLKFDDNAQYAPRNGEFA